MFCGKRKTRRNKQNEEVFVVKECRLSAAAGVRRRRRQSAETVMAAPRSVTERCEPSQRRSKGGRNREKLKGVSEREELLV